MIGAEAGERDPGQFLKERHPDVQVIRRALPGRLQGCVDPFRGVIWLDEELTPMQARCVLAYEIGELQQGPAPTDPRPAGLRQREAEEWAAQMLIDGEDLAFAFRLSTDLKAIADHLRVDVPTLRARLRAMTDTEQDAWMEAIRSPL